MPDDVVVGYTAEEPDHVLGAAARVAMAFGAPLRIVFAFEPPAISGGEISDHRRALEDLGERTLRIATERAAELAPGTEITAELIDGRPADALRLAAATHDALVIVVGTHGAGPVTGGLLGSTTYHLVRRSPVPVLVVPTPKPG